MNDAWQKYIDNQDRKTRKDLTESINNVIRRANDNSEYVAGELDEHADSINDLQEQVKNLDGAHLIKTTVGNLLAGNCAAISGMVDTIMLKRAKATGDIPNCIKAVIK